MKQQTSITINSQKLQCTFCKNGVFVVANTMLNKSLFAMFDFEAFTALNKKNLGKAYICTKCGLKHEFFENVPAKQN